MLKNKKKGLLFGLAALFSLGLASCDDIEAHPSDYEEKLVEGVSDDVINNIISIVYDAIEDSGKVNQRVLREILVTYANGMFGELEELGEVLAKGKDSTEFKDYVTKHSYYNEDLAEDLSDAAKLEVQYARMNHFVNDINERVNETLFNELSSSSYSKDGVYYELKYARGLKSKMYEIEGDFEDDEAWYTNVITPKITEEDVDDTIEDGAKILHLERYSDYITRKIIPDVYLDRLTEQYVYLESYPTLGRSAAREVEYIAIQKNNDHQLAANYLIDEFIKTHLNPERDDLEPDLEVLADAWRGSDLESDNPAYKLLEAIEEDGAVEKGHVDVDGKLTEFFRGTAYGDLLYRYSKIDDDPNLTDVAIESEFTNSNSYPKETGLEIKLRDVQKNDYTTDGWYIRNGGLSSLPSDIRSRLFNIGVANDIDPIKEDSNYLKNIKGKYFLKPSITENDSNSDILWYDSSSQTYYLIAISEAVNATKMNRDSGSNYTSIYNDNGIKMEETGREISKILAETNASNEKAAQLYFLKTMEIQYHDQKVYDYFVANWPDLFED